MMITLCRAKIHRATVTESNLEYEGSLTIDRDLIEAAGLHLYEKIQVVNINTGARLETYVIEGEPGSGTICLNGAAARLGTVGDKIIIIAYGHFTQFPSIGTMFENSDYDILARLQAGSVSYGVMGNPDLKPERTVQYEVGYKQNFTRGLGCDLTLFYKDIRDLLGVEFIETYTGAEYARLTNVDFGSITGMTVAVDYRSSGPFRLALDYTLQRASGNSSDPSETANRAAAGQDPRPRVVPFNWDQTHTLNLTLALSKPRKYLVSAVTKFASGQRYTPETEQAFGFGAATNSGKKPAGVVVDLQTEWTFDSRGRGALFLRVFNLFDARYFNGPVYATTGSPYYARFPSPSEQVSLRDPTRLFQPRQIEFGVRLSFGGG